MRDFIRDMTADGDLTGYALVGLCMVVLIPATVVLLPFAAIGWLIRRLS